MPVVFTLNRRQFLARMSVTAGAIAFAGTPAVLGENAPEDTVRLALLSDTHVAADPKSESRKFFPTENLESAVAQVVESRPDAALLNGDLARSTGEVEDYQAVKRLLAPLAAQIPVCLGLGNHDNRLNFFRVFGDTFPGTQKVTAKHVLVLERGGLRFIFLDSLLYVNQVAGLLGKTQREWLGQYLTNSDARPTVLFVHHTLEDGDGDLLDADRLFRLIRLHPKVKAVFYGHSHRFAFSQDQGRHLVNIPAVGYNFEDSQPVGWVSATFTPRGAQLKLRVLGGNRQHDGETTELIWA